MRQVLGSVMMSFVAWMNVGTSDVPLLWTVVIIRMSKNNSGDKMQLVIPIFIR